MLNPYTRILFAIGAIALLIAAFLWAKLIEGSDEKALSAVKRAALPMTIASGAFALGVFAMMFFGPWAKPYKYNPAMEAPFQESGGNE